MTSTPWVNHGSTVPLDARRASGRPAGSVVDFRATSGATSSTEVAPQWPQRAEHTPRASYATAAEPIPHFMDVPDGAAIWAEIEDRWSDWLAARTRGELVGASPSGSGPGDQPVPEVLGARRRARCAPGTSSSSSRSQVDARTPREDHLHPRRLVDLPALRHLDRHVQLVRVQRGLRPDLERVPAVVQLDRARELGRGRLLRLATGSIG